MKKTLLALFVGAIALTGCVGKSLTINGTVADSTLNGQMVYMTDLMRDSIIDSVVVADSKFTFVRNVDSLYVLTLKLGRSGATVLAEVGTLNVELGRPSTAKGLPLNDLFYSYGAQSDSLSNSFQTRYQVLTTTTQGFKGADSIANAKMVEKVIESLSAQYQVEDKALSAQFVAGNENNALGILLQMNELLGNYGYELPQIDSALALYNPVVAKISRVQSMRNAAVARTKTSVGDMFTDFDGFTADGQPTKLSDFVGKGNYVLVDFWASWCGPCRRAIPEIKELYNKYKADGFVVVGANVWDKKAGFEKAMVELDIPWAQICNFESRIPTELYGVMGIPQILLFAPDGTIVARDLHGKKLAAAVTKAYTK